MAKFDPEAMAKQVVAAARGFIERSIAPLQQRADKMSTTVDSLERRLSRHGEHLARLESRLQKLERGG